MDRREAASLEDELPMS